MNANFVNQLLEYLMGFESQGAGAYVLTTRLTHPTVVRISVFVGDGPNVALAGQDFNVGAGPLLIANGRGAANGMTQVLLALGVPPTGRIPNLNGLPPQDDDPYWSDWSEKALRGLLRAMVCAMVARFRP